MNNNGMRKIILNAKMEGGRWRRRPRKGWIDARCDINSLGIRKWRLEARNRL
jgi:hypothetical protein